jgi:hypothetical protein
MKEIEEKNSENACNLCLIFSDCFLPLANGVFLRSCSCFAKALPKLRRCRGVVFLIFCLFSALFSIFRFPFVRQFNAVKTKQMELMKYEGI